MPGGWSEHDERMDERIKADNLDRGMARDRAEEVAARTVNQTRREEGRTPNETTQGPGDPNEPLEERTKRELYDLARARNVPDRSKMNKRALIEALRG